jgi:hypothetical protein
MSNKRKNDKSQDKKMSRICKNCLLNPTCNYKFNDVISCQVREIKKS